MAETPGKSGKLWSRVAPLVRGAMNSKAMGALGELAFALKAVSLGFGVSKPHVDNERYDFIVDSGKRLSRVQVKTTFTRCHRGYRVYSEGSRVPYTSSEIDFLVVYIAPRDIWYVIPVSRLSATTELAFYPDGCHCGGYFEAYREAWHLLAGYASASSLRAK